MNRLKIILKEDHTLHEMMIGIIAANVIIAAFSFLAADQRKALYAIAVGLVTDLLYVIHMAVTIDDAMCLDEKGAAVSMRKHMIIRYVFVCAVVASVIYFKIADPVFLVISIIMIKAGPYLQPLVHRSLNRRKDK